MERPAVAMTSRRAFAGAATALAVISLAGALAVALAARMHLPAAADNGDVIGWITLHHYNKLQEQINFFGAIALVVAIGLLAFSLLRRFAGAFELRGASRDTALFLASLAYVPAPVVLLAGLQRATLFSHPLKYAGLIVAAILIGHAVVWRLARRHQFEPEPPGAELPLAVSAPGAAAVSRLLSIAIVFLTGTFVGWFLPNFLWFAPDSAAAAAHLSWVFAPAALAAYLWLCTKSDRAVLAFLPAGALILVPFAELHPALLAALGAAVAGATWFLAAALLRGDPRLRRPTLVQLAVWLTVLGTCIYPAYFIASNPNIAHGQNVGALDGDNELAWLNDSVRGRLPYKNFSYPYGPLEFAWQYLSAKTFGLDRFGTPLATSEAFAGLLGAALATAAAFVRPLGAIVAVPILFLIYGFEPRVWSPLVAFAAVLRAYAVGTRPAAILAGAIYGVGALVAPEFVAFATLAALLVGAVVWFDERARLDRARVMFVTGWIAAGAALVLLPALAYMAARGMLVPYVEGFLSFIGVVDRCCGTPYAPLVDAGGLTVPPGTGFLWLLDASRFRMFYLPPVIYGIGFAYVIARRAVGGPLSLKDRYLLGILLFGTLLFRNALGRSDEGHVTYTTMPAGFVALLLAERAVLAGFAALRAMWRERARSLAASAAGFGLVAAAVLALVLTARAVDVSALTGQRLADVTRALQNSYNSEVAPPPDRVAPTAGWRVVPGPHNEQFLFREPPADDMQHILAYLRAHLKPGESVYGMPYDSRYEMLLGLTTPVDFGPEIWSVATRKRDRERLVAQLRAAKPRYVIYDETEWPDSDGVSWLDRYPEVARFLFSDYHVETLVGRTVVFALGAKPDVPDQLRLADLYRMPNLLAGWYYPQEIAGRAARWSTTAAELTLTRRRDQSALSFDVLGSGTQHRTLGISIEGKPLKSVDLSGTSVWRSVHVPVPPGTPAGRALNLRLTVDTPVFPPIDNRIDGAAIARIGFETPAELRTAELDALHAVASPPARGSFELQGSDDRAPLPSVAYRGSIDAPRGTQIDEVFVSFDGLVPARASQLRVAGSRATFSGKLPLGDVSPGPHIVTVRAAAVSATADALKLVPVAEYGQTVALAAPRGETAAPALGPLDASAHVDIDRVRTQEGSGPLPAAGPVLLARGRGLTIAGWATAADGRPFARLIATVDGRSAWPVTYRVARPDADAAGTRAGGFFARLAASALPPGDHQVALAAVESAGRPRLLRSLAVHVGDAKQTYYVDAVNGQPFAFGDPKAAIVAQRLSPLAIAGWAVDAEKERVLGGVQVFVDGRYLATARYGIDRGDVATALKNPAYAASGFEALASVENLRPGTHELRLVFRGSDGALFPAERSITLLVK